MRHQTEKDSRLSRREIALKKNLKKEENLKKKIKKNKYDCFIRQMDKKNGQRKKYD